MLGAWVLCDLDPGHMHGRAGGQLHLRGVRGLLGPGLQRLQAAPALAPARQVGVTPSEDINFILYAYNTFLEALLMFLMSYIKLAQLEYRERLLGPADRSKLWT